MKQLLFLFLILGPISCYAWQSNQDKPILSQEFSGQTIETLDFQTKGLSVQLNSWEEDRIYVEVLALRDNKPVSWDDPQLEKKLEAYQFNVQEVGNRLIIQVDYEKKSRLKSGKDNILLLFKVMSPPSKNSFFNTDGGSITLAGMDGKQQLKSHGGSIRAIDCKGEMSAESSGGSIFVDKFKGEVDLNSGGGSLRVDSFSGSIKANSSGGNMSLTDISGKAIALSEGGSIKASFVKPLEEISMTSKGAGIDLILPKELPMTVNFSGSIVVSKHLNFEGETKKTLVKGTINGGGIPVSAITSGANVRVDYN
ncbi:hypothetical protein [Shivajiella indica]|uniref:Adhesin domain-containing protein n=1 Tax=Shivajiella indica TaxID=872115 RepID=A0ABW5BDH0_9BACT